jgi:hypothetical protein
MKTTRLLYSLGIMALFLNSQGAFGQTPKPKKSNNPPKNTELPAVIIRPEKPDANKPPVVTPIGNEERQAPVRDGELDGPKSYTSPTEVLNKASKKSVKSKAGLKLVQSYIGLRGAANFSTINGLSEIATGNSTLADSIITEPYDLNFMGGLALDLALSKRLGLQLDLNYGRMGYRLKESINNGGFLYRENMVHAPLLLNIKMGKQVKVIVGIGGYVSYRTERAYAFHDSTTTNPPLVKVKFNQVAGISEQLWDYGAATSLGVQVPIGRGALRIEGRYLQSLNNAISDQNNAKKYGKYNVITPSISVFFPLGPGRN